MSLLTLSQPGTGVRAFMHSQKSCKVSSAAETKNLQSNIQFRRLLCLNYRNIENHPTLKDRFQQYNVEIFKLPNITNDRWKSAVRGQMSDDQNLSSEIDTQLMVDEYLESIDRRYKRVHQDETKDDRSQRGFTSAWAWLTADESSLIEEETHRNEEDALSVLGLAELASLRLLHKHHLPVTQSQQLSSEDEDSIIIDVRGEKDSTRTLSIRAILAAKSLARFLNSMQKAYTYRCVILSLQLRAGFYNMLRSNRSTFTQFLAALSLTSRCMIRGRFASQFAVMAMCAVVIVIRPFKA
eukprot:CAMPEP_0198249454 /NCGR_PEP_ID=MMETSP1447-20131203/985_1 /TAXON_ID=420782 /ORGANISM="Chaetoceros dichaeta, Strain CCMP1751" /LENGTH=295 /DNA_ID=CAMNT_0043934099 /DNA_START=185 /DNA_END=1072 /DNA_ORIENTATION=+